MINLVVVLMILFLGGLCFSKKSINILISLEFFAPLLILESGLSPLFSSHKIFGLFFLVVVVVVLEASLGLCLLSTLVKFEQANEENLFF